jgi:hypothetical protein
VPVTNFPTSGLAYAREVLGRKRVDDRAKLLIGAKLAGWEAKPLPPVLSREERDAELGIRPTAGRLLERGPLPAYLANGRRVTPADLVMRYIIDQILASFPFDEGPLKLPGGPYLRPKPKPSEPVKAVHERPADAPPKGRPRKQPDLAAQPAG